MKVEAELSLEAHRASINAYALLDLGSREGLEILVNYYKFDRQDAIDGWNKAFDDNKALRGNHHG